MSNPIRWENDHGRVRWQPADSEGNACWVATTHPNLSWKEWVPTAATPIERATVRYFPLRVRWQWRARLIAARHERKQWRRHWRQIPETGGQS